MIWFKRFLRLVLWLVRAFVIGLVYVVLSPFILGLVVLVGLSLIWEWLGRVKDRISQAIAKAYLWVYTD